ncbi:MAG: DNA replication/repair protein RecF [Pseudomonadota bacterium]
MSDQPTAAKGVAITTLKLDHFRNYDSLRLTCDARHVVLTGENGSGKTNLLEAISFLSPGRGLRRTSYDQVAKAEKGDGGDGSRSGTWAVHAQLDTPAGDLTIGTGLQRGPNGVDGQRRITINGAAKRTSDDLLERLRVVWLVPAMDGLFTGPTSDRRRFLDRLVLAIDPGHGRRVNDYERAMRSRNKLLDENRMDDSWLGGIEAQLAEQGTAIAFARAELVGLLAEHATGDDDTPFPSARLLLVGALEEEIAGGEVSAVDLEDRFRERLASNRYRDRAAGRTLEGPHRSNLAVIHAPKNMAAALCSTGEQKALLTGLVLAHARLVSKLSGIAPILLLDECAAHLDAQRRAALFDLIDTIGCQAWMTGTDAPLFDALQNRAQYFTVDDGTVRASP